MHPAHFLIAAGLAAVACWLLIQQARFSPAVSDTLNLAVTAVAQEGLFKALPAGLQPMNKPESFDSDTLSEKIDGKAELYLAAGFKTMRCRRYQLSDQPGAWFELFLYEMDSPRAAFSVYSLQQRAGGIPLEQVPFSYTTDNGLYAAAGPWYLEVMGASGDETLTDALAGAGKQLLSELPADLVILPEAELLPTGHFDLTKLKLESSNVFGCQALNDVFTAPVKNSEGQGFVSLRAHVEEAESLAREYLAFLEQNMGTITDVDHPPGARVVDLFGLQEVVFSVGPVLAGIHEAEDNATALEAARMLYEQIQKQGGSE